MSINNPAEFPEGGEGTGVGTGRIHWRPGHGGGGGPAEYPVFQAASSYASQLVAEIMSLNARVQGMETQLMSLRLGGQSTSILHRPGGIGPHEYPQFSEFSRIRPGGPQELEMEGGEGSVSGGSGGGIGRIPQPEINEFQARDGRVLQSIVQINERLANLEARVTEVLEKLSAA